MGLQVRVSFVLPSAVNVCCCRLRPRPPCIPRYNTAHRHSPHYIYSLSSLSAGWALCCTKKGRLRGVSPPLATPVIANGTIPRLAKGALQAAVRSPSTTYNLEKKGGEKKSWEICRRRSSDVAGEREWWEGEKKEGELVPLPCPSCFSPFFWKEEREREKGRERAALSSAFGNPLSQSRVRLPLDRTPEVDTGDFCRQKNSQRKGGRNVTPDRKTFRLGKESATEENAEKRK